MDGDDGRLAVVKALVEKPDPESAPSTLAVIGRYVLLPEVFAHLGGMTAGVGGRNSAHGFPYPDDR